MSKKRYAIMGGDRSREWLECVVDGDIAVASAAIGRMAAESLRTCDLYSYRLVEVPEVAQ